MKLVLFNDHRPGLLKDGTVVDISDAIHPLLGGAGQQTMENLIASFEQYRPALERLLREGQGAPLSGVRLRSPLPRPGKLLCMGANYREFGARQPGIIWGFLKSPEAVLDPGGVVVLPPADANIFHHEAEMVAVFGRKGKDIKAAQAMDYVFGYTCGVDVSARMPNAGPGGAMGKSFDTFAPLGPCIVTKDEIVDPHKLQVRLWVDGGLRQDYNTDDMARQIPQSIEWFSSYLTVNPGDVLFTGTNHQGIGALQDGDQVEMEIQGVGRFGFSVSDALKRRWPKGVDEVSARAVREGTGGPGASARPL
ncbi:MAG: fumarylacetoacetate hydrolase family protein [Chloroflexi bacterium]|nr:fumarylacetoacetate hydrolase family protein [Chloroflexota bacterium]